MGRHQRGRQVGRRHRGEARVKGLAIDLADEVAKTGAAKDGEVLQALAALTGALAKISAEKPPAKSVTISAANVGIGNIDQVSGGTMNIGMPGSKR